MSDPLHILQILWHACAKTPVLHTCVHESLQNFFGSFLLSYELSFKFHKGPSFSCGDILSLKFQPNLKNTWSSLKFFKTRFKKFRTSLQKIHHSQLTARNVARAQSSIFFNVIMIHTNDWHCLEPNCKVTFLHPSMVNTNFKFLPLTMWPWRRQTN